MGAAGGGHTLVEFAVETVYKGSAASRVRVQALGGDAPRPHELGPGCGWGFALGLRYTVFARDYDGDGVPNTNGCFQNVEGSIEPAVYGLGPGVTPQRDGILPLVTVLALAGLAALVLALEHRRVA